MKTISSSICINTVEDGTSPYFCDLTNQMGNVVCESDGNTISSEQNVSTDVNYFIGSTKQVITRIVCTMDNGQYTLGTTYGSSGANQYYRAVVTNLNTTQPTVTIYVKGGAPLSTPEKVNIQATANSQPMAKDMTINGIKGGADAVIYQLLPQQSEVSVGRDSNNLLTPQYNSVKVGYTKTQGGTTTTVAEATATIDSKYRVYFRRRTRSTGVWESTYYFYGYSTYYAYIVQTSAANSGLDVRTYDAVEFYLYENTSSNTLSSLTTSKIADRETIPVVSDGSDGDNGDTIRTVQIFRAHPKPNAPTASAIPPTDWSLTPPTDVKHFVDNGDYRTAYGNQEDNIFIIERLVLNVSSSNQSVSIYILASSEANYDIIGVGLLDTELTVDGFDSLDSSRKVSGTDEAYVDFNDLTAGTHFIDIAYKKDDGVSQNYDTSSYQVASMSSGVTYTIYPNRIWTSVATFKNGVKQGSWSTPVPFNGEQGEKGEKGDTGARGKTGRFFYYAEQFNTSRSDTFSATDSEAPFFYYNNNYWVYVGANFTNRSISWLYSNKGGYPSASNSNYEVMVTDFKYLITEALFSNYAHLGSAIINGDWMISQHGTKNGSESTDYTKFDPKYPNESVNTTHTVNGTTWTGYNFVPNYCVDLKTGASYQNDATIRGKIIADDLYHGVAFFSNYGTRNTLYFCNTEVIIGGSVARESFYDENSAYEGYDWYDNQVFTEGKYYTAEEIDELSEGYLTGAGYQGFTECSGRCDTVYVLPQTNNSFPDVILPRPEDFKNKIIDVFGFQYGNSTSYETFTVGSCSLTNVFTGLIYCNNSYRWVAYNPQPETTVSAGICMRFMSVMVQETSGSVTTEKWYWLAAPYYITR